MKRILSVTGIIALAFFMLSSFSLRENPQDPPRGKKGKKQIKMVKVDEDGNKTELDTIIEGENVFVWKGDTIGGGKELKWISKEDFNMEDFDMDFDFDIDLEECEEGHRMIMRAPHAAHAPKVIMMKKGKQGNVIDLSDPGIISYDKKDLKGGKEKITIIRNKPSEKDIELHEEIIMHGGDNHSMIWHGDHPRIEKKIKVIKSDDGNVEIIEDGKVWSIKEGEAGKGTFISEDGNVVHIKEIKEGDEKKIEVKVEIEEEVEKEQK